MRAIYELGIAQDALSMPELLWKAYIDFETEEGEREKARALYERLVQISGHVKVWISYATFEAEPIPAPRAMREEAEGEDEDEGEDESEGAPAHVSDLPSYVLLVGLGVCAVVVQVVFRRMAGKGGLRP